MNATFKLSCTFSLVPAQPQVYYTHFLTRAQEPEEEPEDEVKDAVLVTDADGATGELVLLQLILNRCVLQLVLLLCL